LLVVWCQFPIRPEASLIAVSRSLRTSLSCSSGDLQRSSRRGFTMLEISYTFWQYFWIGLGLTVEPSDVKTPRWEILLSRVLGERLSINPVQEAIHVTVRLHESIIIENPKASVYVVSLKAYRWFSRRILLLCVLIGSHPSISDLLSYNIFYFICIVTSLFDPQQCTICIS
jgi:hypothetical protein